MTDAEFKMMVRDAALDCGVELPCKPFERDLLVLLAAVEQFERRVPGGCIIPRFKRERLDS
jgi:hypothetical protein